MPNANAKHNPEELLDQVRSEKRQILRQIDELNIFLKPILAEIRQLKDYRVQLEELEESIQRRSIKPRRITSRSRRTQEQTPDRAILHIFSNLSSAQIADIMAKLNDNE